MPGERCSYEVPIPTDDGKRCYAWGSQTDNGPLYQYTAEYCPTIDLALQFGKLLELGFLHAADPSLFDFSKISAHNTVFILTISAWVKKTEFMQSISEVANKIFVAMSKKDGP